jgi:hypothetical protein
VPEAIAKNNIEFARMAVSEASRIMMQINDRARRNAENEIAKAQAALGGQ